MTYNYIVIYNFNGFHPPMDNLRTLNIVKAGAGVPVKFGLGGNCHQLIVKLADGTEHKVQPRSHGPRLTNMSIKFFADPIVPR